MLPKKIIPCPIIDAIIELRFETHIHSNAVFGLLYNALINDFNEVENLPILQLPEPLREADPELKFQPHYKMYNNEYVIQVGPGVISISSFPSYVGWNVFINKIINIFDKIEQTNVIKNVLRVGIRYINFFEDNILDKINLSVCLNQLPIIESKTNIITEIRDIDFLSSLQISNNAQISDKIGSVIDIDTFTILNLDDFFQQKYTLIEKAHNIEKNIFFRLLKEDYLLTLNPEY